MCLFITAVVPRSALGSGFDAVVARHRLAFRPCRNPYLIAQLQPAEHYVHTSSGGCDCGSPLFFAARDRLEKQIGKLRAKGWSNAKISRWLEDSRPRAHQRNGAQDRCWSIPDWAGFLEGALALPRVSFVGLIGHWYQGDVDSEPFALTRPVCHRLRETLAGSAGLPRPAMSWGQEGGLRARQIPELQCQPATPVMPHKREKRAARAAQEELS